MAKHRAPRTLPSRAVTTPVAVLALSAAALAVAAPAASAAEPRDVVGDGNIGLLNDLTLLPVQACGLQLPILGSILAAPNADCLQSDD